MKFKIAVVQFEVKWLQPEQNLKKAEEFVKRAASAKAGVIVFPEEFITGPLIGRIEFADFEGEYLKKMQALARKHTIDIVAGSFIEGSPAGLYNTCYYIDFRGRVKAKYQKANLWIPERKYLTPGNTICTFNTRFGKAGLIICYDLMFPEIFRRIVAKGVQIVYCPSFWRIEDAGIGLKHDKMSEVKLLDALCTARAFENEIVLVYANAAGSLKIGNTTSTKAGHSQITVPFKGAIKKLAHNKEQMFIQTVDMEILNDAEKVCKIRKDLKTRIL